MRLTSGHLPTNEKVFAGKVAVCLPFSAGNRPSNAIRAQQGHNRAQYLCLSVASHCLAVSPQQPLGNAHALARVTHRLGMNARPEPSLSPQRHHRVAGRHGVKLFPLVIGGCPLPAHANAHVMDQAGSGNPPRRKSKTSSSPE